MSNLIRRKGRKIDARYFWNGLALDGLGGIAPRSGQMGIISTLGR